MTKNDNKTVEELARIAREGRRFEILQRERSLNAAYAARRGAAIRAGVCILAVGVSIWFNRGDLDPQTMMQNEFEAIYSWQALSQYFQDLGPFATLFSVAAASNLIKYLKSSKKIEQLQTAFIDFNTAISLESEKGENKDAKSR